MFCHYYDSIATIKFVDSKLEKKVIVRVDFVFVYCTGQKTGPQYSKKNTGIFIILRKNVDNYLKTRK